MNSKNLGKKKITTEINHKCPKKEAAIQSEIMYL
jgi:hypothetical protein